MGQLATNINAGREKVFPRGERGGVSNRDLYASSMRRRLQDDSLSYFIPLQVRVATAADPSVPKTDLAKLIASSTETRIAVLGNPGAGKTTIAKQLCFAYLDLPGRAVPVFIDLKRYHPDRHNIQSLIQTQIQGVGGSQTFIGNLPISIIVLDGLNEVADGLIHDALAEVDELAESPELTDIPIVLTCRTIDYPSSLYTPFARYEVQPVEYELARDYLRHNLDKEKADRLWDGFSARMRSLCSAPLLLGMLSFAFGGNDAVQDLPRSRSAIYARFLSRLDARTRERIHVQTPEDIRNSCYAFLAYAMQNRRVDAPLRELRRLVTDYFKPSWAIPIGTFQREILDLPPMGSIDGRQQSDAEATRSFMHQSFQEYFTAHHLADALSRTDDDRLRISDLTPLLTERVLPWRETFGFLSGMLADSTELVVACREEDNTALAAFCVEHADTVDPGTVDELICKTLEKFKYGDAFVYDCISSLQRVLNRRSGDIPQRVIEDIDYWAYKYARASPQEMAENTSDEEVINLALTGLPQERVDAIWTLGQRRSQIALETLEDLAAAGLDSMIREYGVMALGRIAADRSFLLLKNIATNRDEGKWIRAYALHAIGNYPSSHAVEVLVDYLADSDYEPFADDAAWALSTLANNSPELVRPVVPQLFDVLTSKADRYTKGCVLFVMACGNFVETGTDLIRYLDAVDDPYILEDGSHTLGVLKITESAELLGRLCDPISMPDALTRREAVKALKQLGMTDSLAVTASRNDPVAFVRAAAGARNSM